MYRFTLALLISALVVVTDGQIRPSTTTCAAPRKFPGTTFTIYDINDQPIKGARVPKGGYVQLRCANGYLFSDGSNTSVSNCRPTSTAEWHPAVRPCQRICPLPKTSNVELTCEFNDLEISCNNTPLFSGTEIKPRCKELHHLSQDFIPDYTTIRCLDDGTWNRRLFKCVPDCGLPKQDPLIQHGSNAVLGQYPWHVAIYSIPREYRLICGGTLIAPNVVLSAAHCFYNASFSYPLTTPSDYAIVVGKLTRNYTIIDDVAQERLPISKILFNEKPFNPGTSGYVADIALIILERPCTISTHVLPVCFSAHERIGFKPGTDTKGILCGWGLDETNKVSDTLKTVQLPFIHYNQCSGKLPGLSQDKFCAGADRGPRARTGDSGGGLVFKDPHTNFYYIRGIVSTSERFSESAITSFTDVSYYQYWIESVLEEMKSGNKTDVPLATSTENFTPATTTTKQPTSSPGAKAVCPTLQLSNVDLTCRYRRKEIDCNGSLMSGVEVTPSCKPVHYVSPDFDPDYTSIRCKNDGRWENTLFKCIPDCGVPPQQTLVAHGDEGKLGQLPWLVAIYQIFAESNHVLICSGTLITQNVVLSVAHCFYDHAKLKSRNEDVQNYYIMVGKITRNATAIDNEFQKKIEIAEIVFFDKPYDPKYSRGLDIAMIILKQNITLSPYVHPACFREFKQRGFNPGNGLKGILGGWGYDETNKPTQVLKTVQMSFIRYTDCLKMNVSDLSLDQFCAGNGTEFTSEPQKGDSGAGLVFKDPYTNKYHLRGLLSFRSKSTEPAPCQFTDISFYEEWIDRIIRQKSGKTDSTIARI